MSQHPPGNPGTENLAPSAAKHHDGLGEVKGRIAVAIEEAKRMGNSVTLVAVSKTFDETYIRPVIDAGQRVFGENRVQEAQSKWPSLIQEHPDIDLHLIGPLQTNKAKEAVALFDCIETVDRPKLARILASEMEKQGKKLKLFIQVNTGEEPQKAGVLPHEVDTFIAQCRNEFHLDVAGLMCIPPAGEEPSLHFALLKKIADRNGLSELSMGMSGDFEIAVRFGATYVRVGSAIFGARNYRIA